MNKTTQENPTSDLSRFGLKELDVAGDLLKNFANGANKETQEGEIELGDGVRLMFNHNSGNVFLSDEDLNVAMLNDSGKLEMFLSCSNCGPGGSPREDENFKGITEVGQCFECQKKEE